MNYRCLNDLFAYCKGTPKEDTTTKEPPCLGMGCTKDPNTCGYYLKESERAIKPMPSK